MQYLASGMLSNEAIWPTTLGLSGSDITHAWSIGVESSSGASIAERVVTGFAELVKTFGGPRQYLGQRYSSPEAIKAFHDKLLATFPLDPTVAYHQSQCLTEIPSEAHAAYGKPMVLHPTMFSWDTKSSVKGHWVMICLPSPTVSARLISWRKFHVHFCFATLHWPASMLFMQTGKKMNHSTARPNGFLISKPTSGGQKQHRCLQIRNHAKGNPEGCTCIRLCEQFVQDGFITASEPLWVNVVQCVDLPAFPSAFKPDNESEPAMKPFSLGYIKGSARVTTLLAIISLFLDDEVSLQEVLSMSLCRHACFVSLSPPTSREPRSRIFEWPLRKIVGPGWNPLQALKHLCFCPCWLTQTHRMRLCPPCTSLRRRSSASTFAHLRKGTSGASRSRSQSEAPFAKPHL